MPKGLVTSALKAAAKIFSPITPPFKWMVTERLKPGSLSGLMSTRGQKAIMPVSSCPSKQKPLHSSSVSLCTSRSQNASPIGWHFYFCAIAFCRMATLTRLTRRTNIRQDSLPRQRIYRIESCRITCGQPAKQYPGKRRAQERRQERDGREADFPAG